MWRNNSVNIMHCVAEICSLANMLIRDCYSMCGWRKSGLRCLTMQLITSASVSIISRFHSQSLKCFIFCLAKSFFKNPKGHLFNEQEESVPFSISSHIVTGFLTLLVAASQWSDWPINFGKAWKLSVKWVFFVGERNGKEVHKNESNMIIS